MLKKYKYYSVLIASSLLGLWACSDEDEIGAFIDVAPNVTVQAPGNVKVGRADVILTASATDGVSTPLAGGTLTLLDANNVVLATVDQTLSGTSDTLKMDESVHNISARDLGTYKIVATARDAGGLVDVSDTVTFDIFDLPFDANFSSMYIAGSFNGWPSDAAAIADWAFELVGPNTWELKEVPLSAGDEWKLKNQPEWPDAGAGRCAPNFQDWGDGDGDGVMEAKFSSGCNENSPGNGNTRVTVTGIYTITFNDETFEYTLVNTDPTAKNLQSVFMLGNFNDFFGEDYALSISAEDNVWAIDEAILEAGDRFRFYENANGTGAAYGDNDNDGTAEEGGMNIVVPDDAAKGYYRVEFNDETLEYSLTFVAPLAPENLFLVGSVVGWDASLAIPFRSIGDGVFELYEYIDAAQEVKFLPQQGSFDGDYGLDPNNAGGIVQEGESNVPVADAGFYRIIVDFNAGTFSFTETNWGIIGSATPGGWDSDTDMTLETAATGNYSWTIDLTLTDGEVKFRANDDWGINYGSDNNDGVLNFNSGTNIAVSAGTYTITITLAPEGYTYTIE